MCRRISTVRWHKPGCGKRREQAWRPCQVSDTIRCCFGRRSWTNYKPVAFSTNSSVTTPKQDALVKNIRAAIQDYISSDIEAVIKRARDEGDTNKLGVALVRAGRYTEAKKEFQKAADRGSIPAMNNVANILMIEKNYTAAAAQYKRILDKDPENKVAQKGLENANAKIE